MLTSHSGNFKRFAAALTIAALATVLWQVPGSAVAQVAEQRPLVDQGEIINVSDVGAAVELTIPHVGDKEDIDVIVCYGTQDGKKVRDDWEHQKTFDKVAYEKGRQQRSTSQGDYTVLLDGLEPETNYFYRVYTTGSHGTTWSDPGKFFTLPWMMPWWCVLLIVVSLLTIPFVVGGRVGKGLQMPDHGWKIGVILCTLACGIVVVSSKWPPQRGIDLSGGVIMVYEVDQDKKRDDFDMEQLIAAINRRVNPGGLKEVTIRPYGPEQIEITIPRASEDKIQDLKSSIIRLGSLEFRILANNLDSNHKELIERAADDGNIDPDGWVLDEDKNKIGRWVPVKKGKNSRDRERVRRLLERGVPDARKTNVTREFKEKGGSVDKVLVGNDEQNVTGEYLTGARPDFDQTTGQRCVSFQFDSEGAVRFSELTGDNVPDKDRGGLSWKLGVMLDDELYSAPVLQSMISNRGQITGSFGKKEVKDLVEVLNAGALPTSLNPQPMSELKIGPTLGEDTIRKGGIAIAVSMTLVLLFMLYYYRFAGIIACAALLTNLILILGVMMGVNAAFTLPGLAGLVLTVGMAVDANVLVFERIREEINRGAALRMAIRNGFAKATTTIVDANLTTLITAVVLYIIGTEQVKGFAITLFLGVVLSMYTAIFCSRVVFDIAEKRRWITELKMMRILGATNIDFLSRRRLAATISMLVIVVGLTGVIFRGVYGPGMLDIDFTGGVSVEVLFNQPQKTKDIRKALLQTRTIEGVVEPIEGLADLAFTDAQFQGEPERLRFVINTSQQDILDESDPEKKKVKKTAIDVVEEYIQKAFGGKLASLEVRDLQAIEATTEAAQQQSAPPTPPVPDDAEQSRNDLPHA